MDLTTWTEVWSKTDGGNIQEAIRLKMVPITLHWGPIRIHK